MGFRSLSALVVVALLWLALSGCEQGQRLLLPIVKSASPGGVFVIPASSDGDDRVYLTIDDGPSVYTGELLDLLAKYGATATLFLHTDEIQDTGQITRAIAEGHNLGHHMPKDRDWSRDDQDTFSRHFFRSHCQLAAFGPGYTGYFRPPMGQFNQETMAQPISRINKEANTSYIMASFLPWDAGGLTEGPVQKVNAAVAFRYGWGLGQVSRPGDIVVFHDGPKLKRTQNSIVSIRTFLDALEKRGLRAVALPASPTDTSMCEG
ncbi:MAG: polysaccharide deacetylase family protein [Pseudomonadota bacterium]